MPADPEIAHLLENLNANAQLSIEEDGAEIEPNVQVLNFTEALEATDQGGQQVNVEVPDGGIDASKIGSGAVGTNELADNSVTSAKIPADAIGSSEIAADAVGESELDLSITPIWTGQHQFNAGIDVRGDIVDDTAVIYDASGGHIEQSILENDSVTVAGNTVALGGSTSVDHSDLSNIGPADHHTRYSNEEAQDAVGTIMSGGTGITVTYDDAGNTITVTGHNKYTDEEAQDAVGTILGSNFTYDDVTPSITLASDSVTVTAGDGLKNGGTVALGGTITIDIEPADFAGNGLQDDGNDNLEIPTDAIGTDELDLSITPTWTGTHTWDTGAGANISLDETGLQFNTSNQETLNFRNTGTGSVQVQEDGTTVVKETRTLTGGNAIDAIGDLSSDRTIAVSSGAIQTDELDLSITPVWTGEHQFNAGIEIATGQSLEDDNNVERFRIIDASRTGINNGNGELVFDSDADAELRLIARSGEPLRINDVEGGFNAFQYLTSASAPGTLELSNSRLHMNGNQIREVGAATDANNGAIRMGFGSFIGARDSVNNGDILMIGTNDRNNTDYIRVGEGLGAPPVLLSAPVGSPGITNNKDFVFWIDESNTELEVDVNDGTNSGTITVGSYSTKRLKRSISTYDQDPYDALSVEAKRYTIGESDDREKFGFIAEDFHDEGLDHMVLYRPTENAARKGEGISEQYMNDYAHQRQHGGEKKEVLPDNIRDTAIIASHHEIIRDLHQRVKELEKELAA